MALNPQHNQIHLRTQRHDKRGPRPERCDGPCGPLGVQKEARLNYESLRSLPRAEGREHAEGQVRDAEQERDGHRGVPARASEGRERLLSRTGGQPVPQDSEEVVQRRALRWRPQLQGKGRKERGDAASQGSEGDQALPESWWDRIPADLPPHERLEDNVASRQEGVGDWRELAATLSGARRRRGPEG